MRCYLGIADEGAEIMEDYKGSPALDAGFSLRHGQSSITRSLAMAHSRPGPTSSDWATQYGFSNRPSLKKRRPMLL
jgi:hypothetical protein